MHSNFGLKSTSLLPILLLLLFFSSFASSTLIVNETLSYPTYGFMIFANTECIQQDDVQGIVQFMYCDSTLDELVPQPQPQQFNYIILLIGGDCESHVLESFIENETVGAVLVLDDKNPTVFDGFIDYRECRNPSNPSTMKQLQYMPTKNASIIEEELHNGDLVILTWEPNSNQSPTSIPALLAFYSIFLVIWSIIFIIGFVFLALEMKRNKIRMNAQTLKLFLEYRKNFNMNLIIWIFLRVGILLIEIGRIIFFIIPLVQNGMQTPRSSRILLYFTDFVGFSLFSILAFNWLNIALLTLQYKDIKIWKILKIILIICCSIVDLVNFLFIFTVRINIFEFLLRFNPQNYCNVYYYSCRLTFSPRIWNNIWNDLSNIIQYSKQSHYLELLQKLLLFLISTFVVFAITPYQSPVERLGPYSFFELTAIFLLIAFFILVGYQQEASQMKTINKFSSNLESDQSHSISVQEITSDQTSNI